MIIGLLRYWPITNYQKEVMFLTKIEEILEATSQAEFQKCMAPLFRRIAYCITSSHFQVTCPKKSYLVTVAICISVSQVPYGISFILYYLLLPLAL
jgi:hypothetical protein